MNTDVKLSAILMTAKSNELLHRPRISFCVFLFFLGVKTRFFLLSMKLINSFFLEKGKGGGRVMDDYEKKKD